MKVLILNQCATNKGDRAVLYFLLRELAKNGAEQVTVSTSNPDYWHEDPDDLNSLNMSLRFVRWGWDISLRKNSGILKKFFHMAYRVMFKRRFHFVFVRELLLKKISPFFLRFLCDKKFLIAAKEADVIISTGGHHLTTMHAEDAKYSQTFDMAVALILKKPLILWSQSIGEFEFKKTRNKELVKSIISGAEQVYIRDEGSKDEICKLGLGLSNVTIVPESVFGLYDTVENRIAPSRRDNVIGLSVWTGRKKTPELRRAYVDSLVALFNHAVDLGYNVKLFPMELAGDDMKYLKDIASSIRKNESVEIQSFPDTPKHINLISDCKVFVGHKTHSVIFSLIASTPLLAISYHPKTNDFMRQFGIEQNCINDTDIDGDKLIVMFDDIVANLDSISEKQEAVGLVLCKQVQSAIKDMLTELRLKHGF